MHRDPLRDVTDEEVETFAADGVVPLRGMFDTEWIDLLADGMAGHLADPTDRARVWDRDAKGRTMLWDSQAWTGVPAYQRFIWESPAAQIAARLLGASEITFFFDAVFVRSPGAQFSTPWHQDEPYWSIEGFNTCSIWMPLVPVKAENALSFVPGSHLTNKMYDQFNFGEFDADGADNAFQTDFSGVAEVAFPDIDADPAGFGVTSWDLEPGDCVAFNSRTIHGGSGKLPDDTGLSVFTSKWIGDDVRVIFREQGMDPDHTDVMVAHGLRPGDRPSGPMYPTVWTRDAGQLARTEI